MTSRPTHTQSGRKLSAHVCDCEESLGDRDTCVENQSVSLGLEVPKCKEDVAWLRCQRSTCGWRVVKLQSNSNRYASKEGVG